MEPLLRVIRGRRKTGLFSAAQRLMFPMGLVEIAERSDFAFGSILWLFDGRIR
jgi:hypothetical protein